MKVIFSLDKFQTSGLLRKDVLGLTGPILAEQTLIMVMGVVNTIMAARLGKEAISAVGMVDSLNMVFIAFLQSLATGGTVVIAHYAGQGSHEKANDGAKQALYSGVVIATLITILIFIFRHQLIQFLYGSAEKQVILDSMTYLNITLLTYPLMSVLQIGCGVLRGAGDTRTPMKVTVIMNFMNVVLSYLLIYGINFGDAFFNIKVSGLGIKGAALGIAIARSMGTVMIMIPLLRGSKIIKITKLFPVRFDLEMQKSIFGIGIPAGVEALMFHSGRLLTQVFIVGLGTAAIAANNIVSSITTMVNIPGNSMATALTTLVGQHMGRGEREEARGLFRYLTMLTVLAFILICIMVFPTARVIASLYSNDPEILNMSALLLRTYVVLTVFFWAGSWLLPAGLRGAGDAKYAMVTSIFGMWFFRIILGYILGILLKFGLPGIWIGMYTDWAVRGTLYFIRYRKGRWMENKVIRSQPADKCVAVAQE